MNYCASNSDGILSVVRVSNINPKVAVLKRKFSKRIISETSPEDFDSLTALP